MKFEYYGEDSNIIDEDMIGNPRHELAIISLVFSIISIFLIITKLSGFLAAASGFIGVLIALKALRHNRKSTLAKVSLGIGLVGGIIGSLLFVSCISCTACTIRNLF